MAGAGLGVVAHPDLEGAGAEGLLQLEAGGLAGAGWGLQPGVEEGDQGRLQLMAEEGDLQLGAEQDDL